MPFEAPFFEVVELFALDFFAAGDAALTEVFFDVDPEVLAGTFFDALDGFVVCAALCRPTVFLIDRPAPAEGSLVALANTSPTTSFALS